jgi:hypothetical protein
MNNSHTLKGLESQLARLESDLATCKSIIREKNIELNAIQKNISKVKDLIESLTINEELIVSEHAVLRYLERVQGQKIEDIQSEILTDTFKKLAKTLGDGKIPLDKHPGFSAIIKNGIIVTIIEN